MYQVLYRKYRPTTFEEVVGQEVITKTLKNAIVNDKISHAYLFTGPRGTGKTTIAKILAKTINCENLNEFKPCNSCVSCTQINIKQSTDIVEIDAASNNGVDEIREIRNKVNLVPAISKYKVYIIDEVHMLTVGAFNALLKTLEEPPAHIIFVLATTEPHKIPTTILSRCQRFDFKRIPPNKIVERLKFISQEEKIDISDEALFEIARLSDGGMRDSISMLDQVLSYSDAKISIEDVHEVNGTLSREALGEFVNNLCTKNILETLKLIDKYNDSGKNIVKLTEEIIIFLKNVLLSKTVNNYLQKEEEVIYRNYGNNITTENLISLIDLFNDNIPKIKQSNDPKLILELLVIQYINSSSKNVQIENIEIEEKKESTKEKMESPSNKIEPNIIEKIPIIKEKKQFFEKEIKGVNPELTKKINQIKEIRINNTLSGFNKKILMKAKEDLDNIRDLLLFPEYSQTISTILDGSLKAASERNLVFVFETDSLSNYFNENLPLIEEILEKTFNQHYDVISVGNISWEIIKKEFNSKTKKYLYQDEPFKITDLYEKDKDKDELTDLFGEIIEIVN